jgi:hypothetical protein
MMAFDGSGFPRPRERERELKERVGERKKNKK